MTWSKRIDATMSLVCSHCVGVMSFLKAFRWPTIPSLADASNVATTVIPPLMPRRQMGP